MESNGKDGTMAYEEHDDVREGTFARDGETTDQAQRTFALPRVAGARVFLVRHADSDGPKDAELGMHLSDLGLRQARALATRLANWQLDAILCSDMHRARETAAAVHSFHRDVPLIVDRTFREASAGTLTAFERGDPDKAGLDVRLEAAWKKIVTLPYRVAVLVTHNGMIKYLLGRTLKCEVSLKPHLHSALTGITAIQVKPKGKAQLKFFNDARHLTPELAEEEITRNKVWMEDSAGRWRFGPEEDGTDALESA
jgi:broad specificity phosphatase PhoE